MLYSSDHQTLLTQQKDFPELSLKGIHNGRKTFDMLWRKLCLLRKLLL